jgi:hypothetical protein
MGGGGSSGPTQQQKDLQTSQAMTTANLNLEENDQRKTILNAMQGTRVFRGSALSRAVAGNTPGGAAPAGGPAAPVNELLTPSPGSLFDVPGGTGSATTNSEIGLTAAAARGAAAGAARGR